jgi:2-keto-4-pentenoate hydratase/2-oxohepta-3-ene-1,7-dioic acid hydratase in catechol pathway
MKWVQFNHRGAPAFGVLDGETIKVTSLGWADILAGKQPDARGTVSLSEVDLLAPVGRPGKIVAIGLNYMDHIRETNDTPPDRPLVFTKFTTALNHPGGAIVWSSSLTQQVDYEAELAVVIGKTARRVGEAEALGCVFGYTCGNDVSARDVQLGDRQWIRGKSLDTFCPLGPALVTADEIPDPQTLAIRCLLNGETMQKSNTAEMIFSVARLISFCSQAFTLEPGDVILTGTPHGVGMGRDPKVFMKDGDQVAIEIERIGRLENTCRVED